ncbi:nucleotide disphospho-sugar-binding domain-containing protein [Amycolatopsis tolypomycina]|uniref:nucleotide disphospho-sugar-binding domain-containing protein n=1 Tax=Amycolatopsis tolypomycina TaxID=208445 RepID=UPI0033ACACA1
MRVLFTTLSGVGHLFPMVPLAQAVRAAGHTVLFASDEAFAPVVRNAGLPATAVLPPSDLSTLLKPPTGAPFGRFDPQRAAEGSGRRCGEAAVRALPAVRRLVERWRPDLVVSEPMELAGPAAASEAGVPWVRHFWGLFPPEGILRSAAESLVAAGLAPLAPPVRTIDICPAGLQFPATTPVTPMRYVPHQQADVPGRLAGGGPRVCLTLGTMLPRREPEVAPLWRRLLDGFLDLGHEVVIAIDPKDRPVLGDLPGGVRADWVPLAALLPTCAAIVHHGGMGSLMTAVTCGVPQLVVPHFGDQFRNAERITEVGAGLGLSRTTEDPAEIGAAVARLVADGGLREVSRRLAAENAVRPSPAAVAEDVPALTAA